MRSAQMYRRESRNVSFSSYLSPHITSVQYCGGCSVHYCGGCSVHRGDNISTGGITSVLWGIASVLWRLFSTMGDSFSTVGDRFSTVDVVQYSGGITSVHAGDNISTVGDNISTVEVFSTVEGYLQYCGG